MTETAKNDAEREAQIRERLAKATPGPWTWEDWNGAPPSDDPLLQTTLAAPPTSRAGGPAAWCPDLGAKVIGGDYLECGEADKTLIANAPSDLAFLLSALDDARADAKQDKERLDWLDTRDTELRVDGWRRLGEDAEADTVREAVDEARAFAARSPVAVRETTDG